MLNINSEIKKLFKERGLNISQKEDIITLRKEKKVLLKFYYSYSNISVILLTLLGIKPAFYGVNEEKYLDFTYVNRNINKYMDLDYVEFTRPFNDSFVTVNILYNNELTNYNKKEIIDIFSNMPKTDREIGLFLGFPPIAVEDYIVNKDVLDKEYIGFCYYGITFACYKKNLESIKNWLEEHYEIPQIIKGFEYLGVV